MEEQSKSGQDPLDPKNYTKLTLEELRARQEAKINKGKSQGTNESVNQYWDKVRASYRGGESIGIEDVKNAYFLMIKVYENKTGIKWQYSRSLSQVELIIDHLHKLINRQTKKGLMLAGSPGIGKTTIMSKFYLPVYQHFTKDNWPYIIKAENLIFKHDDLIGRYMPHCLIDDLGREINYIKPDHNGFSPSKQFIADQTFHILDSRRTSGKITHVTTNVDMIDLVNLYGTRSQWRFDEMFEIVIMDYEGHRATDVL